MTYLSSKHDSGKVQKTYSNLTLMGYIVAPFLVMSLFLMSIYGIFLPRVKQNFMHNRQRLVRDILNSTWNYLSFLHESSLNGNLTIREAQQKAIKYYSRIRYGDDNKDYFWIITIDSEMVMHPYQTHYIGRNFSQYKDKEGRYVLPEMVEIARSKGDGFITYYWQWKDDPGRIDRKISYVKLFKPWGWIIGTGVYINDIEGDIEKEETYITWFSLGIFVCLSIVLGYILFRWYSVDRKIRRTQAELLEKKEHYRALFESSGDALILLDSRAVIVDCNQKAVAMFGVDIKEDIIGLDIMVLSEKKQGSDFNGEQLAEAMFKKAFENGSVEFEWIHKQILGKKFPAEVTLAGIPGSGRNWFLGIIRDVGERKRVESVIRDSEERFRKLFELNRDGLIVVHPDGQIIDCNPSFQNMVGYSVAELQTMSIYDFQSEEPDVAEARDGVLKTVPRRNFGETFNKRFVRRNGNVFPAEVTAYKAPLSNMTVLWVAIRDVTLRKLAERTLRESEFRFRTFFNSNPEGVALMDTSGTIKDCNKTLLEMSGYDLKEIAGQEFERFVPHGFRKIFHQTLRSIMCGVFEDGTPDMFFIKKNGEGIPISVKVWPLADEAGSPLLLGVFIRDITDEKNLAEEKASLQKQLMQTQRMEAIGTLAGGIAHDFNNILSGMIGYTELALARESHDRSSKTYGYLTHVLEACDRAKELVRQILTFSRREEIGRKAVNVAPLVKECIKLLESTMPPSVSIVFESCATCDLITANPTQIHQVVMNLCTNAFHAMRKKGGILGIYIENAKLEKPREFMSLKVAPGDFLKITVTDTGHGMPAQVLERIFEPYFTTRDVNEGTGLGLSVILGIIRGYRGLIEVESSPGQGTRFDILFPRNGTKVSGQYLPSHKLYPGQGERVLIVDDEQFFLDIVGENLEQLGYTVQVEKDSKKALERIIRGPDDFDLLITDLTMPGLSGFQLAERAKAAVPGLSIILCTGYSETLTGENSASYGIDKLLQKPVSTGELARAVHLVLQGNFPN